MQTIRALVMIQCASFDRVNETGNERQNDRKSMKRCARSPANTANIKEDCGHCLTDNCLEGKHLGMLDRLRSSLALGCLSG